MAPKDVALWNRGASKADTTMLVASNVSFDGTSVCRSLSGSWKSGAAIGCLYPVDGNLELIVWIKPSYNGILVNAAHANRSL